MGSYLLNSSRSPSKLNLFCYTIVTLVCLFVIGMSVFTQLKEQTITSSTQTSASMPVEMTAYDVMLRNIPESEQSYRGYVARTYRDEDKGFGYVVILHNGKVVHFNQNYRYYLGHVGASAEFDSLITMGKNITGNGIPNLVISEWSGGAHCCTTYDVFELGEAFRHIATIDAGHGEMSHFEKRNGVKGLVFVTFERVFANWRTSSADSPSPKVILRYCDNEYRLADNLMRKPLPSPGELQKMAQAIRKEQVWKSNTAPPVLWEKMLDLIYSGNSSSAYRLFDMAWHVGTPGKDKFRHEFVKQLEESQYWPQIKMMNEGKPVCRRND